MVGTAGYALIQCDGLRVPVRLHRLGRGATSIILSAPVAIAWFLGA